MAKQQTVVKEKRNVKTYLKNSWQLYAMLIIPVVYMILFKYKPMLGVVVAFKKFNVFQGIWNSPWIGLANFEEAFSSRDFWNALANTLILNIGDLIIGFPIPIFLAIFLNELRSSKIRKTTQTLLYLPNFLSWVIIAGISTQLFSSSGLVNNLLNALGFGTVNFLTNSFIWRIVYWFFGVWQGAGYSLIVYLAALMATDASLGEAAYIDGATRLQRIWYVTLPQISSTITVLLIMQVGKLVSISFDRPYMMGNSLVRDASDVISTYVYSIGLAAGRFDFATAVGLFQTVVGVVLVLSANAVIKKMGQEGIV
ncbi:MAG TPA: ABC transporter permease subunit [Candidatus Eisenbergiella intestinigallinarum]|uniref:ABC transporter permease subunit n=1 Tax=Candidatus Eisenbergiella intestinigallinarum TaxID=2838549 RepID=A0A9D2TSS3_9FIRM|nr:ABC transporter permease subunit [Candidatus Eisenbergiella intestinigallinarum]